MGRICFHPCETSCNRAELDEAVGINAVERFLGDLALERGWALPAPAPDTGSRVLVVGSGPAGLSAAYHLRRRGHGVHLVDGARRPGGMMHYGIPAYRLPREVLAAEIRRVVDLGVELELGRTVTDVHRERDAGGYDAVFLAVGAQLARRIDIPAGDSSRVLDALSLLHGVAEGDPPQLGRRVVVYGGGDTAVDAARTARRLGATDAVLVYRRSRDRMPAHSEELEAALDEGVTVRWLTTVDKFAGPRMTVERMELDEDGSPRATGEFEELDADSLVLAIGQDTDLSLLGRGPTAGCRGRCVGADAGHDDQRVGHLRRRRRHALATDGDGGRRARCPRRPGDRRLPDRPPGPRADRPRGRPRSTGSTPGTTPMPSAPGARNWSRSVASAPSTRS